MINIFSEYIDLKKHLFEHNSSYCPLTCKQQQLPQQRNSSDCGIFAIKVIYNGYLYYVYIQQMAYHFVFDLKAEFTKVCPCMLWQ